MAGYSGTPLAQKLGIKAGARVGVVRAPAGFERTLGALPEGAVVGTVGRGKQLFDVMICFVTREDEVARDLASLKQRMNPAAGLWMSWPKRTTKTTVKKTANTTPKNGDLDGNVIRRYGLAAGLVDNKVCAVDEVWSGLRFVIRLADRSKAPGAPKATNVAGRR
jgi:hypothetical protein